MQSVWVRYYVSLLFCLSIGTAKNVLAWELGNTSLNFYGNVDAMMYRYALPGFVDSTWSLNGIRENVIGIRTPEPSEAANGETRPIVQVELGFGADRGLQGRSYRIASTQVYVGGAGDWGQVTVGQQYNVMTNIAWSLLNPIDNGWGIYFNDLLYIGDTFTYQHQNTGQFATAGANWFMGYLQRGAIYQYKGSNFSVQADYAPYNGASGLGGSYQIGQFQLAAAAMQQSNVDDAGRRRNAVFGGTYEWDKIKFYLSQMQSQTSSGVKYTIQYGGFGWQAHEKLHLSLAHARYRQNAAAAQGGGSSLGLAFVADYSLTPNTSLYVEADERLHYNGNDGLQTFYSTPTYERNVMVGFSYSF